MALATYFATETPLPTNMELRRRLFCALFETSYRFLDFILLSFFSSREELSIQDHSILLSDLQEIESILSLLLIFALTKQLSCHREEEFVPNTALPAGK